MRKGRRVLIPSQDCFPGISESAVTGAGCLLAERYPCSRFRVKPRAMSGCLPMSGERDVQLQVTAGICTTARTVRGAHEQSLRAVRAKQKMSMTPLPCAAQHRRCQHDGSCCRQITQRSRNDVQRVHWDGNTLEILCILCCLRRHHHTPPTSRPASSPTPPQGPPESGSRVGRAVNRGARAGSRLRLSVDGHDAVNLEDHAHTLGGQLNGTYAHE